MSVSFCTKFGWRHLSAPCAAIMKLTIHHSSLQGNERGWSNWLWLKSADTPSNSLFVPLYHCAILHCRCTCFYVHWTTKKGAWWSSGSTVACDTVVTIRDAVVTCFPNVVHVHVLTVLHNNTPTKKSSPDEQQLQGRWSSGACRLPTTPGLNQWRTNQNKFNVEDKCYIVLVIKLKTGFVHPALHQAWPK